MRILAIHDAIDTHVAPQTPHGPADESLGCTPSRGWVAGCAGAQGCAVECAVECAPGAYRSRTCGVPIKRDGMKNAPHVSWEAHG